MKILKFILFLVPWFLASLIVRDYSFYNELNLPFFAIPKFLFPIFWTILYILIAISCTLIKDYTKDYKKNLIINYLFNQSYIILFFLFKSTLLGLVSCLLTLLTSLFLYYETKEINKLSAKFLIPYVLFLTYATILSISIYFMNL